MKTKNEIFNDGFEYMHHMDFWDDSGSPTIVMSIRKYLDELGFSHIPLPQNDKRLFWDYLRPNADDVSRDYIYCPVIICFTPYKENGASLYIYNEEHPHFEEDWNARTLLDTHK